MNVIAFPFVWLSYGYVRARGRKSQRADRSDMFMGGVLVPRAPQGSGSPAVVSMAPSWQRTLIWMNLKKRCKIENN